MYNGGFLGYIDILKERRMIMESIIQKAVFMSKLESRADMSAKHCTERVQCMRSGILSCMADFPSK